METRYVRQSGTETGLQPDWYPRRWAPSGRTRVQYSDLSSEARTKIDQSRFASLRTWADVCRAFAAVQIPKGKVVNGWVVPPLAQGDGTVRSVQVYVVEDWSGWKLATFQCSPVERQPWLQATYRPYS